MAERSQLRESEAQDGRSERPATGCGEPGAGLGENTGNRGRGPTFRTVFEVLATPEEAAYPRPIAAASGKRSWIGCTPSCSVRSASMASTQASAAGNVVMQGTP